MEGFKENNQETQEKSKAILGWIVDFKTDAESNISVEQDKKRVVINPQKFDNPSLAYQTGIFAVAKEVAVAESLRQMNPMKVLEMFSQNPDFVHELLRLTGARILGEREPDLMSEIISETAPARNSVKEFKEACAIFLATGDFPPTTEAVKNEIDKLPVSSKGEHLLQAISNEQVALSRKLNYFDRFIAPAFLRLSQFDADIKAGSGDDFKPSTDSSETMELNESEIMQFVEPFFGGYFREKVMDGVDWQNMKVVATGVLTEKLLPPEEARQISEENKIFSFKGKNGIETQKTELSAPLPASVKVLPETLTEGFVVRRSLNGIHTIEWEKEIEPLENYEFQFEKSPELLAWQKMDPTNEERGVPEIITDTFSPETKEFLEGLKTARITESAKVNQVVRRTQKNIEYVNDSAVGSLLDSVGQAYFAELEKTKKGDCDVCNFYALAQIRALDISCRMVTGYHISRDKRFPFAALAGTKHAWLEWWDKEAKEWKRADATPPALPEEKKKDKEEGGGGREETNFDISETEESKVSPDESDDDPWSKIFEDEDMEKLKKRLIEISNKEQSEKETTYQKQIFENIYGVSKERWEEIRVLAEKIGQEKISSAASINGLSPTVSEEWKNIFELMYVAYRLPQNSRLLMGRESQGGELVDPVSAGIDVMLNTEDPYGYQKKKRESKENRLPIYFSNDFLLDSTASMKAKNREGKSLLDLEREFVISSLYEGYKLNEKMKQKSAELKARPIIVNHILSIHGGDEWQEILKTRPVSMKELVVIDDLLKKSKPGAGAMAEAIESYQKTLEADKDTMSALKNGDMVKTLTIITDGNLWCSACGKESCSYQMHGPTLKRTQEALEKIRGLGVIVNAIGFTEQSRPVTELFSVPNDPVAAVVTENLGEALKAHYLQIGRAMKPVIEIKQGSKK